MMKFNSEKMKANLAGKKRDMFRVRHGDNLKILKKLNKKGHQK